MTAKVQAAAPAIQVGASDHYRDGEHYARRYAARTEDVDYYLRLAQRRERILEFGCGTGRLTVPLAQAGHRVTAVDPAPSMLSVLSRTLEGEAASVHRRVRIVPEDMRTFRTNQRFDLIILAFHTFCHLYSHEDVSGFLGLAFQHLAPGGLLAFDLPMPRIDMLGYDPIAQVRVTMMDGPSGPQVLTQRLYFPQEVLMHLHYAGFRSCRLRSDYGSAPVTLETDIIGVIGRKPRRAD